MMTSGRTIRTVNVEISAIPRLVYVRAASSMQSPLDTVRIPTGEILVYLGVT